MSHPSEDRLSEQAPPPSPPSSATAQILPFPRQAPEDASQQSELQKAVLLRAQEALERDRARDKSARKVSPVQWIVVLLLAAIPVALMVYAADGFLRAWHRYNEVASPPPAAPQQAAPAAVDSSAEPGVVILQPPSESQPADVPKNDKNHG